MKWDTSIYRAIGRCVIILDEDETIESSDLADFLFLFRGVYAAGIQLAENVYASGGEPDPIVLAEKIRKHLQELNVSHIDDLFRQDLGSNRLLTERISHGSPFEIVLCGSMILIVAAIILSGGTIELGERGFKATLPPLGIGIEHLRRAITSKTRAPVGYGVKSRTIHLNKTELVELMRQDPATKERGGFQRFLVGLQSRVNKKTGRLELSEKDMDRIIKAGKDRTKGGFQARIYKIFKRIFERHFDFGNED